MMSLHAQRETANWYFGNNSGIDFNSGTPVVLSNGELNTTEGCSTVSDANGDLLFYTNGVDIWDRTHGLMQNGTGLLGDVSSTQSTIIIPNISNSNVYYVFTADVYQAYLGGGSGNGLNYSIVDMSLNGGLGSVISKNNNLLSQGSEKLTAVSALDNSGFWVLAHAGNTFYAYKVDGLGVHSPVESTIGINVSNFNNLRGSIKFSPNGKKVAIAHALFDPVFDGSLNLYDFNLSTGVVSNEIHITSGRVFYSIEFSPDSSKLYTSSKLIIGSGGLTETTDIVLHQYDIVNTTDILRSEYLINTFSDSPDTNLGGTLQLAFDKKIYHAFSGDELSVINQPNLLRRSMDFQELSIHLGSGDSRYGLPSYEQSAFESIIEVENLCFNNATKFNIIIDEPIQSIFWDFGDPDSGVNNTSNDINPTHLFTSTGRFTVTMNVDYVNRETKTYIEFIDIGEAPSLISQVELTQCDVDADDGITRFNLTEAEALFDLPSDDLVVNYFETFSDALNDENALDEDDYTNSVNGQVIFAKIFINADCYSIIEVKLNVEAMSNLGLYSSINICQDEGSNSIRFHVDDILDLFNSDFPSTDISIYRNEENALLENSKVTGEITVSSTEAQILYFRVENENACSFIGSFEVGGATVPLVEDKNTIFCDNDINFLDAGDGYWSYLWSNGETTQKIQIDNPGSYWVEVSTGIDCSNIINFVAVRSEEFNIDRIDIRDFRPENNIRIHLDDYSGLVEYSLDSGITFQESNYFDNVSPGIYNVLVRKDYCHFVEQTILVGGYPSFFTPNGDGVNDTWKMKSPEFFQEAKIKIYDRYGKLLKVMNAFDGWDGKHEGNILTPSDYWFSIALNDKVVYGHFTLKL